jgi:hypothetical protein
LRKKKLKQVVCGGSFVIALGKDVPDGSHKIMKHQSQKKIPPESFPRDEPTNQRAHSQTHYPAATNSSSQMYVGGSSVNRRNKATFNM